MAYIRRIGRDPSQLRLYAKVPAIDCSRCCLANAVDSVEVLYHGKDYRPAQESKVTNLTVQHEIPDTSSAPCSCGAPACDR